MKEAPIPDNEPERQAALDEYELLSGSPEEWFDDIVAVAAEVCSSEMAMVNLLDWDQQLFKAAVGVNREHFIPERSSSFCGHAIVQSDVFEIPDAREDERFHDNPWTLDHGVRFYAGVPLVNADGYALGTICVLDRHPRHLDERQKESLKSLARVVMKHIETRRAETFGWRVSELIQQSDDFVAMVDATTFTVLYVNDGLADLVGTASDRQSLKQLAISGIFPSLTPQRLSEWAALTPDQGSVDLFSETLRGADQERVVSLRITPSRVRDRPVLLLVAEDMEALLSSRKREEQAASEVRRLALVARKTDNPVIITDAEDHIEWVNPSFESLTGYPLDEVRGLRPGDFLQGPDTDEQARRRLAIAIANGEPVRQEILNYSRQGHTYWLDLDIQPVHDDGGRLVNFVAVQTDITRRKELEHRLRQAKEDADRSNQAKSQFLANISHELRTPLNGIIGISELLQRDQKRPDAEEQLSTLKDSANGLLEIINDLLDLSKIEARSLELELRPFDLDRMLRNLDNLFRPQAEGKGVTLHFDIEEQVPRHLHGDEQRLRQVLMNLLGNALKFTQQGTVTLAIDSRASFGDTCNLAFRITDSGPGIEPSARDRIFEPFGQADASLARRYGGTGLGLTICQRLVELMGGSIQVESEEGQGATFSFVLPLLAASETEVHRLEDDQDDMRVESFAGEPSVLLVDDNPVNRHVGEAMLGELGMRVTSREDGAGALEAFSGGVFDLVLLDIQMPDMNGYDVAIRMRDLDASHQRHTPLVAVTAHSAPDLDSRQAGFMDGYLTKPLTFQGLYRMLSRWLAQGEHPTTGATVEEGAAGDKPASGTTLAQEPMVDRDLVLRNLGGNPRLMGTLKDLFEQQHEQYLEAIARAHADDDAAALAEAAHGLKGAVGYFTAGRLWQAVSDMEKTARDGSLPEKAALSELDQAVREMAREIRNLSPDQS
ncbi:ATP-binding protein [Halospina sp. K52047b]|uniref:ATP-binding protein n=1 Tax=Halospina sp. K52047b TaxID=2614160 RepID=UPI00124A1419|nr:ATP-binding protein [Halospina sp. K52047b]KAA8980340.1 PAS domain-containing protein [Halospina sp. K52047b]